MVQKIINALLYAGVEYDSFELVRPRIKKTNRTMTIILSSFASILIFAMLLSSFRVNGVRQNRVVYELGLILSIVILGLSITATRKFDSLIMPLVYLSYMIYYVYGIMIGAITDPTGKTVTFIVMLVFLPTLFIDRPIHSILTTVFYVTIFIILCLIHKEPDVCSVDIIDAIIFGLLGVASGSVVNHMKVRGYVSEQKLHSVSRTDQLTKMNNQSAFKLDLYSFYNSFENSLACIYIDANGLHRINNEYSHKDGDKFIQCVASQILANFGQEMTYRAGGDEFIAFAPDIDEDTINEKIANISEAVEKKGYSVAIGYAIVKSHRFSIEDLVHNADLKMKEDKNLYHAIHDR